MDITGEKNSKTALSYLESSNMDEQNAILLYYASEGQDSHINSPIITNPSQNAESPKKKP